MTGKIGITKKEAENVEIIKKYAAGDSSFNFTDLGADWDCRDEYELDGIKGEVMKIVGSCTAPQSARLERAFYQGYEIEPNWKFDIGDIVYLSQGGFAERRLWFVSSRFCTGGLVTYGLCADYNPNSQAYHEATAGPHTSVNEDRLVLISKNAKWAAAVAPKPPMHPGCGHGSKTQY